MTHLECGDLMPCAVGGGVMPVLEMQDGLVVVRSMPRVAGPRSLLGLRPTASLAQSLFDGERELLLSGQPSVVVLSWLLFAILG